jgi:hypothetical protein
MRLQLRHMVFKKDYYGMPAEQPIGMKTSTISSSPSGLDPGIGKVAT